jgi:hypothetical protein
MPLPNGDATFIYTYTIMSGGKSRLSGQCTETMEGFSIFGAPSKTTKKYAVTLLHVDEEDFEK